MKSLVILCLCVVSVISKPYEHIQAQNEDVPAITNLDRNSFTKREAEMETETDTPLKKGENTLVLEINRRQSNDHGISDFFKSHVSNLACVICEPSKCPIGYVMFNGTCVPPYFDY